MNPQRWTQIEDLFHRAAECQPDQRPLLLDHACEHDADLRREVEALLSSDATAAVSVQSEVFSALHAFAFPLIGHTIGHYKVLEGLDGGGMGLVYRAEDNRLGRQVALKFLFEEAAADPSALERFALEARAASALEHPNICPIYEFGEHQGQPFLVMPLLQGHTLRDLIAGSKDRRGPLPFSQLLDIAVQVAEGLSAAHRRGLIHRDIKPANIFITNEGQAKILDFGLAKITESVSCAATENDCHFVASPDPAKESLAFPAPTRTGSVAGTAGYMSPEQLRGEKLDSRADLFSFGAVLFEMATGKRAFAHTSGSPPTPAPLGQPSSSVRQFNPQLPAAFEKIVAKALQASRSKRYQTATEMRDDLLAVKERMAPRRAAFRLMVASFAALLLLSSAGFAWVLHHRPLQELARPEFHLRQLTATSSENHVIGGAISPDGKYLAYADSKGLYLKRVATGATQALTSPGQNLELSSDPLEVENDNPHWFPDSHRFIVNIAAKGKSFAELDLADSSIWEVTVPGGSMRKLRDSAFAWSVSFDGSLIAFTSHHGKLGPRDAWLMGPNGENARQIEQTDSDHAVGPFLFSADGRRLAYIHSDSSGDTLFSRDLLGHPPTFIFSNSQLEAIPGMLLLPDGRAIYSIFEPGAAGTCNFWTARLDPGTLQAIEQRNRLTNWTGFCMDPTSSTSDGKTVAFKKWATNTTVYLADLAGRGTAIRNSRHFTLDELANYPQDWTPDSGSLIFFSLHNGEAGAFRQRLDTGTPQLIASTPGIFFDGVVSPDGAWVLWQIAPSPEVRKAPRRLMRVPIGGGQPETLMDVQPDTSISCARLPSKLCVLAERSADRGQVLVSELSPLHGRGREVLHFPIDPNTPGSGWLSPDGSRFAVMDGAAGPIRVFSLRGTAEQIIPAQSLKTKQTLRWAADGKAFFVTNIIKGGSQLLRVDQRGNGTVLWENQNDVFPVGLPSPDGRHLAIQGSSEEDNIWLLEHF